MNVGPRTATLAAALGVENPGRWSLWLLRLFVLPPSAAKPCRRTRNTASAEADPGAVQRLCYWLAVELGVRNPTSPLDWSCSLLLARPPLDQATATPDQPVPAGQASWRLRAFSAELFQSLATRVEPHLVLLRISVLERFSRASDAMAILALPFRLLTVAVAAGLALIAITTPLTLSQQAWFTGITLMCALLIRHAAGSLPNLLLIALALLTATRYAYWRLSTTLVFESPAALVCGMLLLLAELYTWLILLQGFVQTVMPLRRRPVALPPDLARWPSVDVFIPTYNESLRVVRATALAALRMDWPADRLQVYLLDDGRREEFRVFAAQAGIGYITRSDNAHAKAGNLNHALTVTHGEFIAIFDCDHVPTRSFLQLTMGWMLKDPRCALVQTPHHFFSADPFEHNLKTFRRVPGESELFHRLIQDGNDLWNAAFFAGSCAVLRRAPLEEIGGIAVETVTEDAHTALKLHRRGYNSAYLNTPQAAGLATESLAAHIAQRIRWARGMVQIFRIDNPFLGRGLTFFQRVCYANAMLHFFHGLPRLIFLTAPLSYLFFELHIIHAEALTLAGYVVPYLIHTTLANGKIQGAVRHSLWASVYETVLSWYINLPTILALINPKLGKFNVTPKGAGRDVDLFDWNIARPLLLLLALNTLGFGIGLVRLFWWNAFEDDVVVLNLLWTTLNLMVLGTAVGVAQEARQAREAPRVAVQMPATLGLPDGRGLYCEVGDYSFGGLRVRVSQPQTFARDQRVYVGLQRSDFEISLPARIRSIRGDSLGLQFEPMSLADEAELIQCTFAKADAWQTASHDHSGEHPIQGLMEVLRFSLSGFATLGGAAFSRFRTLGSTHRRPATA